MNASRDTESSSNGKISNTKTSMSSTPWLRMKDPRIVRVSRAFGGKDRHSKVCTIRGLRDRRVRLSVPTAIQLYDLQEKLGFSQPSKVIDWLLEAAKNDIDKLPPLPFAPESLTLNHQAIMLDNTSQSNRDGVKLIHGSLNCEDLYIGRHGFTELHNLNIVPLQSVNLTTASHQNFLSNSKASFSGFNFVNQPIIKPLHFTITPRLFQDEEDQTNNNQ